MRAVSAFGSGVDLDFQLTCAAGHTWTLSKAGIAARRIRHWRIEDERCPTCIAQRSSEERAVAAERMADPDFLRVPGFAE